MPARAEALHRRPIPRLERPLTSPLSDRLRDAPALRRIADARRALGPLDRAPVTRFAPSPTGELHLGHVVHALWVWGVAAHVGATVLLRMEDHDRTRCTPEFERAILHDLAWLGFAGDPVSTASLAARPSLFRQSDVPERYAAAFDRLRAATPVYGCTCTRAVLGPPGPDGERRYPGTCRGMPLVRDEKCVVRAQLPDRDVERVDLRLGMLRENPARVGGDPVIRDALGQWTYQFSVVVDDLVQGVDLVVRGEDLVHSTARQAALARLLGRETPVVTVHHPLVLADDGRKLSKRDRSESVAALRGLGWSAEAILELAWTRGGFGA